MGCQPEPWMRPRLSTTWMGRRHGTCDVCHLGRCEGHSAATQLYVVLQVYGPQFWSGEEGDVGWQCLAEVGVHCRLHAEPTHFCADNLSELPLPMEHTGGIGGSWPCPSTLVLVGTARKTWTVTQRQTLYPCSTSGHVGGTAQITQSS